MSDPVPVTRAELVGAVCGEDGCGETIDAKTLDSLVTDSDGFVCQHCGGQSYLLRSGMRIEHFEG